MILLCSECGAERAIAGSVIETGEGLMPRARPKDLAWEALVKVTNANEAAERGRLNTALRAIKIAWIDEGGALEDLHKEIPLRAQAYHEVWPKMSLTPSALAKHWHRVAAERTQQRGTKAIIDELRKQDNASL